MAGSLSSPPDLVKSKHRIWTAEIYGATSGSGCESPLGRSAIAAPPRRRPAYEFQALSPQNKMKTKTQKRFQQENLQTELTETIFSAWLN